MTDYQSYDKTTVGRSENGGLHLYVQ